MEEGIKIDPSRTEGILQISNPINIKDLQYLIGKINFLRRFIPNLAEILRDITNFPKRDSRVKWTKEAKQSFDLVNQALTKAPILINPYFTKYFIIFSFTSMHTIAAILLQKNKQGEEQTIAFFSQALRNSPLKYSIMEKQALALIKALKYFRVYILHSHTIAFAPNTVAKDILTQDPNGKRGKWIVVILEHDLENRPTKLIKGQGLEKLMVETNFQALDINMIHSLDEQEMLVTPPIEEAFPNSS